MPGTRERSCSTMDRRQVFFQANSGWEKTLTLQNTVWYCEWSATDFKRHPENFQHITEFERVSLWWLVENHDMSRHSRGDKRSAQMPKNAGQSQAQQTVGNPGISFENNIQSLLVGGFKHLETYELVNGKDYPIYYRK